MRLLSVTEVHGGRGVELAGREELVHAHPLVFVVWDLTVPRSRGDDGYAGPRAQIGPVGRAWHAVVARLLPCEILVSRGHRPHQRVIHRGLRRRTLLYYFQTGVEVRVFGFEFRETLFEAPDEVFVGLGRGRADVKRDVGARRDDVELWLPAVGSEQDGRGEARVAEERVLAVAFYLLPLQLLDSHHEPRRPGDGVDSAQRHRPVRHLSTEGDLDPQSALLLYAELVLLRLADDGAFHPFCVTLLDKALDPGHHPLLVHRVAEDEFARKRYTRVFDRLDGYDGRRQVPLRVARPPPVDAVPDPLGPERRMLPVPRPPLGHHVGVRLEEQSLPRPLPLPDRPHVRAPRRDLLRADLEPFALEVINEKAGDTSLVAISLLGTIYARDADELLYQAQKVLVVDTSQHRLQELLKFGVGCRLGAAFGQSLPDAAVRVIGLQAALDRVEEAQSHTTVEDAMIEGDFQVHHAPDRYSVVHDHWALDDGLCLKDGRLRVVYDRRGSDAPKGAGVVHGEGAPRYVFGAELLAPGALHEVVYPAGEADEVQLVGAADDGYDQGSLLQVHRDPDIDLLAEHDPVPVPHRVENRLLFESLHGGLDDERQEGEFDSLALGEGRLLLFAQRRETRHVHLDQRPGVRYLRLAHRHAVRDGPPHARELHDPVAVVDLHAVGWSLRSRFGGRSGSGLALHSALFDVALDVLFGHPAACAGAGDLRDVHFVLLGEPADDRRGALRPQCLGVLDRSAAVAAAVARLGDRALLLAVLHDRLGLGVRGRELLGRAFGRVLAGLSLHGPGFGAVCGDEQDLGADVHGGSFGDEELLDLTRHGRGELRVDLVCVHLGEGLVLLDLVTLGLEPAGYRPLRHALPELGHRYGCRHLSSSRLLLLDRARGDVGGHVGRDRVVAVAVFVETRDNETRLDLPADLILQRVAELERLTPLDLPPHLFLALARHVRIGQRIPHPHVPAAIHEVQVEDIDRGVEKPGQ